MRRRTFLLGLTSAGACSLLARAQQPNRVTVTPDGPTFQPLAIDGGGFLRGMDIHADGTMVVRADTYGAYVGSVTPGTKWTQLMTI